MHVQVVLSTFNGSRFVREQIDSILAQQGVRVSLLVRDDGSIDDTVDQLARYRTDLRVRILAGNNLGMVASYWHLLQRVEPRADYIAFADQDDVWLPDKLSRALEWLGAGPPDVPLLYVSAYTITDRNLRPLRTVSLRRARPGLANALVQNLGPGCTMVFNQSARDRVLESVGITHPYVHDWWVYLVVSALGVVRYDPESRILYRQHGRNLIGAQARVLPFWLDRLRRFVQNRWVHQLKRQAEEFGQVYASRLVPADRRVLERFLSDRTTLSRRIRYAVTAEIYRQRPLDNWILHALIALGRI